jgi:hypothetical protein
MKRIPALLLVAILTTSALLPISAFARNNAKSQARDTRKAEKKQQKATKKALKAQRKAQKKMVKKDRKNTHYPQHSY